MDSEPLCPGCQRVEECGAEECLTQAEIARFALLLYFGLQRSASGATILSLPAGATAAQVTHSSGLLGTVTSFFQISLIIIIIFIFNQELLWEPENGLDLEAHTQALTSSALLLPLSLLVIGASVGGGGLGATRPVCCAVCCGELPLRDSLPPRPASDPSPHFLLGCQLSPFLQSSGAV